MKFIEFKQKFNKIKEEAEEYYKNIDEVYCPYLKEKVYFNRKGLNHIKFKKWNNARSNNDQYMRLKLIHYASEIIKKSHTLQGYSETKEFEHKKINSRWENIWTNVVYYEFIAVIDSIRVRIIVKYVEGGGKYFWSIIPFWKIDKKYGKRLLHNGKPDQD